MLSEDPRVGVILDKELIGFLTAVNTAGQPQTAPVWFVRDRDEIVVYNRPDTPRLSSIDANPLVAFNARGDLRALGALLLEGEATRRGEAPPAKDFPGYVAKYEREIEREGWTPESFSSDYSVAIGIVVTRIWAWGLEALDR